MDMDISSFFCDYAFQSDYDAFYGLWIWAAWTRTPTVSYLVSAIRLFQMHEDFTMCWSRTASHGLCYFIRQRAEFFSLQLGLEHQGEVIKLYKRLIVQLHRVTATRTKVYRCPGLLV